MDLACVYLWRGTDGGLANNEAPRPMAHTSLCSKQIVLITLDLAWHLIGPTQIVEREKKKGQDE